MQEVKQNLSIPIQTLENHYTSLVPSLVTSRDNLASKEEARKKQSKLAKFLENYLGKPVRPAEKIPKGGTVMQIENIPHYIYKTIRDKINPLETIIEFMGIRGLLKEFGFNVGDNKVVLEPAGCDLFEYKDNKPQATPVEAINLKINAEKSLKLLKQDPTLTSPEKKEKIERLAKLMEGDKWFEKLSPDYQSKIIKLGALYTDVNGNYNPDKVDNMNLANFKNLINKL